MSTLGQGVACGTTPKTTNDNHNKQSVNHKQKQLMMQIHSIQIAQVSVSAFVSVSLAGSVCQLQLLALPNRGLIRVIINGSLPDVLARLWPEPGNAY